MCVSAPGYWKDHTFPARLHQNKGEEIHLLQEEFDGFYIVFKILMRFQSTRVFIHFQIDLSEADFSSKLVVDAKPFGWLPGQQGAENKDIRPGPGYLALPRDSELRSSCPCPRPKRCITLALRPFVRRVCSKAVWGAGIYAVHSLGGVPLFLPQPDMEK